MGRVWFWGVSRLHRGVVALIGLSLVAPAAALACPSCKAAIENDPVAAAFNSTTLLMIAAPISLVGSIGGWILYRYWRSARSADALERPRASWDPVWREKESET